MIRCFEDTSPGPVHRYVSTFSFMGRKGLQSYPRGDSFNPNQSVTNPHCWTLGTFVFFARPTHNGIEWIKGLLAVPFVIHSQPTGVFESRCGTVAQMAEEAHRRYAEIMQDVEKMIDDHSKYSLLP